MNVALPIRPMLTYVQWVTVARGVIGACILVAALLTDGPAAGQTPADSAQIGNDLERLLEDRDINAAAGAQQAELLAMLAEHPLDVNAALADELALLPSIGPLLAQKIISYREAHGPFASLPGLHEVDGVTETVFLEARPYLTIGATITTDGGGFSFRQAARRLQYELIQRMDRRLDLGRGYQEGIFFGSPEKLYTRLRARYARRMQLTLTLEKDPGERFAWDPSINTYGYDHVAGHLALHEIGPLKTLIVGDFTANFGQGLTLWRTGVFGKGRDPVDAVARSGGGLRAYSSRAENNFFRGAAATVALTPSLAVSGWISRRQLDATLVEPDTALFDSTRLEAASGLVESGYHRTATELAKKDALGETLAGGAAELTLGRSAVGLVAYHGRFDAPLQRNDQPYAFYEFTGRQLTMASVYGHAALGDAYFFGEVGRSPGGTLGGLAGLLVQIQRGADAVLLGRHYPRDFVSLHGQAFGERSGAPNNETGVYAGLRLHPRENWTVAAYFDQYRFPWLRFAVPRPSTGYEARLVVEHRPRQWLEYYLQARTETREVGADVTNQQGQQMDALRPETRQSVRLHGAYHFTDALRVRARLEGTRYLEASQPDQYGLVLYQDLRWQPVGALRLDLRLAFFDTDSYAARVYTYENDLLYSFSIPTFFGRGQRAYVLLNVYPLDNLALQVKYAVTRYEDTDTIGSGYQLVRGARLRELRGQLRWTF